MEGRVGGQKNSSPLEGLEPLEDARVGGEKAGGFTTGRPLWRFVTHLKVCHKALGAPVDEKWC
jgi:hypothetical protein